MPDAPPQSTTSFLRPTATSAAALIVVVIPSFMIGAFAPAIKEDLGFGDTALGAMLSLGYLVSALILQLGGSQADKRGPRPVMRVGLGLALAGAAVIGGMGRSYLILATGYCLLRCAEALVQPSTNTLISVAVPIEARGRAMGIKQAAVPLSTMLAGLAVPLLGDRIGWRGSFLLIAVIAVPAWLAIPPTPIPERRGKRSTRELWQLPHLRLAAIAGGFAAASVISVSGFLASAAVEAGYSKANAGLLLAVGGAIMIVSRLFWGFVADRWSFNRFTAVAIALGSGSVAHLLFSTESQTWIFVGTILLFGIGWSWPGLMILGIIELHPQEPGAASAVFQTGVRIGAFFSPIAVGTLVDSQGFSVAWLFTFACGVIASILMFGVARKTSTVVLR